MKNFLFSIHRKAIYILLVSGFVLPGCLTQPENATVVQLARVVPDVLDAQTVYPTNHVIVPLDPLTAYTWMDIKIPDSWLNAGYYYELWDANNRPLPGYRAKKLQAGDTTIELTDIDASLYPKIRLVVFQPENAPALEYAQPVYFTYEAQPNYRLAVFVGMIVLIYGALCIGAIRYKIFLPSLWQETKALLRGEMRERSLRQICVYGWLTVIWSGMFGVVLGYYVGGMQILYLLIKLPYLFLGALITSGVSLIILTLLLGIKTSFRDIAVQTIELVATTALGLAAFSPLIGFYILLPQNHDELLVSSILCIGASGWLATFRLYVWLRSHRASAKGIIMMIWLLVYGMVFLQLGWMLRPWVGVIDPISGSVPFARSQSGNVFEEIKHTLERINN